MAQPEFTPYLDALTESMKLCMDDPNMIFIGQQIVYYGNPMSKTIEGLPKERMIETPVMEEVQMGMTNHIDKINVMSDGEWNPTLLIRVGKGSDTPLDPGHQHKADYTEEFSSILKHTPVIKLDSADKILPAYKEALSRGGATVLVEYPELYYTN